MLKRKAWERLEHWKRTDARKALMITGARQIGKTTLVREFAKHHYRRFAELNFLEDPRAASVFDGSLSADAVISNLTAYLQTQLEPGHTLILLDEIQECPSARTAIKFLVEDGRFDYVETGSLLGVKNKQVASYPVGFEEQLRMYPLDFEEFCLANGVQESTIDMLRDRFNGNEPVSDSVHDTMMRLFQAYVVVGGMPDVVQRYVDTHDIAQVIALPSPNMRMIRTGRRFGRFLMPFLPNSMTRIVDSCLRIFLKMLGRIVMPVASYGWRMLVWPCPVTTSRSRFRHWKATAITACSNCFSVIPVCYVRHPWAASNMIYCRETLT